MKKGFIISMITLLFSWANAQPIYVKHDATGMNNGSTWVDAYTDISTAVSNAQSGDQLWIAEGTYKPGTSATGFIPLTFNIQLFGGFNGNETLLNQRNWNQNQTIISGDINGDDIVNNFTANRSDNTKHLIWTTTSISNATIIDGLIFKGGHTEGASGSGNSRGGAAIISFGAPIIKNCTFEQNYGHFGTVYPRDADASGIRILNCVFKNNYGGYGTSICGISVSDLTIKNTDFIGNEADFFGGAMYLSQVNTLIDSCLFDQNTAPRSGGAIAMTIGNYFVQNSIFSNNISLNSTSNNASGAGIFLSNSTGTNESSRLVAVNTRFLNNASNYDAALAIAGNTTTATVEDCHFENNMATRSGGALGASFGSITSLSNCSFIENHAKENGGAIHSTGAISELTIDGSHFERNEADSTIGFGGGIGYEGSISIDVKNSMFIENFAGKGGGIGANNISSFNGKIDAENTYFLSNNSLEGGAIYAHKTDVTLTNSVVSGNNGLDKGGGIHLTHFGIASSQQVEIINSSFGGNNSNDGTSIFQEILGSSSATVNLQNTIFGEAQSSATNYSVFAGAPTINSLGGNLSSDGSLSSVLTNTNDLNNTNPEFVDVANNDLHLQPTSPCINTGIDAGAPTTDIEGNARVGITDMGAFESNITTNNVEIQKTAFSIDLYPNPVHDLVNVRFHKMLKGQTLVEIIGVNGSIVQHENVLNAQETAIQFNLKELPDGYYNVKVTNENQHFVVPFLKIQQSN